MHRRGILAVILLGFYALGLLYNQYVPHFEGPDEPEHFAYVDWLISQGEFPPQGEEAWQTAVRQEASQPPLYYLLAAIPARLRNLAGPPAELRLNPHYPSAAPGPLADNKNIAIHYPQDGAILQGGWLALYLARQTTLLFGMLLIVATYGLARQVDPAAPGMALASAFLVAVIPQVLFISNVVSNDMAAAATGALTLWALAYLLRKGPGLWRGLILGSALGLAVLSKSSNLALMAPVAAGLAWLFFQPTAGDKGEKRDDKPGRLATLWTAVTAAGGTLLVGGWWYFRSWRLYGTPLGLTTHYQAPWALSPEDGRGAVLNQWGEVFQSFWAAFGWGNIKYDTWVYLLIALLIGAALAGLVLLYRRQQKPDWPLQGVLLGLLFLTILVIALALEVWMRQVTAPHGRLLYPALAAAAVLLVFGWRALHPWLVGAGLALLTALALLSPFLLIKPAYAPPQTLSSAELAEISAAAPMDWRFGEIARLKYVGIPEAGATAGEVLPVQLCWQTLAAAETDYSVLLHIVGPENGVVAGRHTYPGLGSYPSSTWAADQRFCDIVRVDIPADLAQTLIYQVEVGLFDAPTGERLPAFWPDGQPLGATFAGAVRLQAVEPLSLEQEPPGDDPIRLVTADFPREWRAGEEVAVSLRWWLASPLAQDYTVFLHLRDAASGENVAQGDGPPLAGWYPTSSWTAGEVVDDSHMITLPEDVAPGTYTLITGWYDPQSGERLGSEQPLGSVEVEP